jgi:peptidoglycan/LPS O-acetylase OafA/YrhL
MQDHVPALDGIRGAGILWVMAFHFTDKFYSAAAAGRALFLFAKAGWIGLEVFFVLSGYLITGILYDTKGTRHFFGTFYARRFLRIFPLYYGGLLVFVFVLTQISPLEAGETRTFLDRLGWYWAFLVNGLIAVHQRWNAAPYNTSHFWSLSLEEQYYLMWPAVVFFCERRRLVTITVAAFFVSALLRALLLKAGFPGLSVFVFTPARLDALAVGSFMAVAVRGAGGFAPFLPWVRPVAVGSSSIILSLLIAGHNLVPSDKLVQLIGIPAIACLSGVLVMEVVTAPSGRLSRWLSRPTLLFFGKYSYSIYLFHFPMVLFLDRLHFSADNLAGLMRSQAAAQLIFYVVAGSASVLCAFSTWHLYEKHFLRLKNRFFPLIANR